VIKYPIVLKHAGDLLSAFWFKTPFNNPKEPFILLARQVPLRTGMVLRGSLSVHFFIFQKGECLK
jgi:hypothetical protein